MKTKDIVTISTTALCTAALTVVSFWGGFLEAGGEGEAVTPKIEQPKLVSHGVELSLAAAEARVFKAGDKPVFELKAVNTANQTETVSIQIMMTSSSVADMLSRVARPQTMLWQEPLTFTIKANETKTITLPVATELPAKSTISVSLVESEPEAQLAVVQNPLPGKTAALLTDSRPRVVAWWLSTLPVVKGQPSVMASTR